jgi:hypothetical protein
MAYVKGKKKRDMAANNKKAALLPGGFVVG